MKDDGRNNSDGIMIAVIDKIKARNMQIQHEKSIGQGLWKEIDKEKNIIKIGLIYAPQEFVTTVRELKKMYESITKEIQEAREHKQQVIAIGNFNVKVGTTIQGTKEGIAKGGRLLLKMMEKESVSLINADKKICKRLCLKEEGKVKPVIDYAVTDTKYLSNIKEMIIDETKQYVTYRLAQQNQNLQKIHSDHNVIFLKIYFHTETIQTKERKVITTKVYKECKRNI